MNLKISAAFFGALLAALGILAPASQPNPVEAARLNNLGVAYMNQQLFEKGLKEFQDAYAADPKLSIARLNEGVAYLNLQKVDEAKAALEDALKQDPKTPNSWYSLGLLAKNSGDAPAAIEAFKHVIEIDPNDADTWYFLGTAYAQGKQFPEAIDAFQHALKINPLHASAEFGLSRAYQQSSDVDHAREHLKRFQYITQSKIGAPMSLAYGEQGQYSRAVESPQAKLKPLPQIKVQFVDVTKEAGIITQEPTSSGSDFTAYGPGACFLDYDNDGRIDIFLPGSGTQGGMSLYHNEGSGKFKEVTKEAGLNANVHALACTSGDYDNDGYVDLAVTTKDRVILFHNEKNGTFKDLSEEAGLPAKEPAPRSSSPTDLGLMPVGVTFIDYDHDGDIDLYVTRSAPAKYISATGHSGYNTMWRNNGNGKFTDVTESVGLYGKASSIAAVGTDYNNDRAVDLILTGGASGPAVFENPREGAFRLKELWGKSGPLRPTGMALLDFDHDGWTDIALTNEDSPAISLWRNNHGKEFQPVNLPAPQWFRAFGVAAFDYDNDGWVDLVVAGEVPGSGKGEVRLFRNLGPDGFKDVTAEVGLDKIQWQDPRAIITGDYDDDGTTDLLITQARGPAVLLRNQGANRNHWLRVSLKGLNDNKSAIGTKLEVFSGGNRQKFEIYGSNGYLGQNSTDIVVGLGESKDADIVRMLWPTGVLQDEVDENQVAGNRRHEFLEIDRRGSSCPTLFAWNGERYEFVADMLGAAVVGHWIAPGQRDIPRPVEYMKIPTGLLSEKEISYSEMSPCHPERSEGSMTSPATCTDPSPQKAQDGKRWPTTNDQRSTTVLSFRFIEPLEEAVYLDQVRLFAVDHPSDLDVYPNEYFASNPPYPDFKVVLSRNAQPPASAWDEHGHDVLPDLLAHRYIGDFAMTQFQGFAKAHSLTLDLGAPYDGGPLWLLLHGEIEYFTANSMYAASQAGLTPFAPYVEALGTGGKWKRVIDDMGFPAGGPRTMTANLTGKLPRGTQKIRITTNLQIYWDNILVSRTKQTVASPCQRQSGGHLALPPVQQQAASASPRAEGGMPSGQPAGYRHYNYCLTAVPLVRADLEFHGYPYKIEGLPPGNVRYVYEKASATGPYTRPVGTYTRYGDVRPLLLATDDKLAVFGSGDEVRLDFDPSGLPALPQGWVRDYFFSASGYEKDMDFYAAQGNFVAPLPFLTMGEYPYSSKKSFPLDDSHVNYLLEYNTRHMSGDEQRGYWFDYGDKR
jgi:tetratricopeptide (TPR) repeat protein